MNNTEPKIVEKEKIVAEKLNGRFAMLGFVALVGAYLTTGQIIPGVIYPNFKLFRANFFGSFFLIFLLILDFRDKL